MNSASSDTSPAIEKIRIDLIRSMPAWKKMAAVNGLNELLRGLAVAGIRQTHPDATPDQVRRLLADRMLGPELAAKVYGDGG